MAEKISRLQQLKNARKGEPDTETPKYWYYIRGKTTAWVERYFSTAHRDRIWSNYEQAGFEIIPIKLVRLDNDGQNDGIKE